MTQCRGAAWVLGSSIVWFVLPALAAPLPLEVAFSTRTIPRQGRPALSPDGRFLAYEVQRPVARRPGEPGPARVRFLPSGLPSNYARFELRWLDLGSRRDLPLCREPAVCFKPSFSPDSRHLAYSSDEGGELHLRLLDLATGESRRLGSARLKGHLWNGDEPAWSPDGRELFVHLAPDEAVPPAVAAPPEDDAGRAAPTVRALASGTRSDEKPGEGSEAEALAAINAHFRRDNLATLAALDVATGAVRVVVPSSADPPPSCLRLSPDGAWLSYLSVYRTDHPTEIATRYDLVVVPVRGGAPRVVASGLEVPEDDYFGATYRWTPDSRRLVYFKGGVLFTAPAGGGEPRALGAGLGPLLEEPLLVSSDSRFAVVAPRPAGFGETYFLPPPRLLFVPLDGGAAEGVETAGWPVPARAGVLHEPEPGWFLAVVPEASGASNRVLAVRRGSPETRELWRGRARFDFVGVVGRSGALAARFEGLQVAPEIYRFSPDFRRVEPLTVVEPRLAGVEVGPLESFSALVPAYDGALREVEPVLLFPPGGKAGAPLPTLVVLYPGARLSRLAFAFGGGAPTTIPVSIFTSRGYAVLFVDVPLTPEGRAGQPLVEMADAVLPQIYRAAELGWVDLRRLAVLGQSYGGYGAAGLTAQTRLFRAAIASAGSYDLGGGYGRLDPGGTAFGRMWSETGQGRMGTHPWADLKRYLDNSPYYQAERMLTPLLLLHGREDYPEEAEKMYSALERLGRQVELAIYDGEGHAPGAWALANAVDAVERMLAFLEKYLGGAPAEGTEMR